LKVFVDANVLFSAAYSDDNLQKTLLQLGASKGLHFVTCDYAVEEALRNLQRKTPPALARLSLLLTGCSIVATPTDGEVPRGLPPKDHPIWRGASATACEVLLTGDRKDFGKLKHPKFRVLSPRQLFEEVLGSR
jgi:predicted nucleic acid-binding protein